MKYTKVIEAIKFTKDNFEEVKKFTGDMFYEEVFENSDGKSEVVYLVDSLCGLMIANFGDYIIRDKTYNEYYPCSPEVFERQYKRCEE